MKKKVLLLICVLFGTALSFAQGFYEVKVNGNAMHSSNAYCSYYEIKAVLTNNDERMIVQGSFTEDVTLNINASIQVSSQYKVKEVRFYARRHHKRNCRTPSKHQGGKTVFVQSPYDCLYSTRADHGSDLFGDGLWSSNLTVQVNPLVEVQSPGINDFLPLDHRINLRATTGFPERLSTYTWQYSMDNGNNYQDFPAAFNGRSTISANAREILGANAVPHLGKKIQVRIKSCGAPRFSRFPRTYTVVPSAPTFEKKDELITSCYANGDGSVRFTFSRPLIPGEKIAILPLVGTPLFPSSPTLSELQTNPVTGVKDSYTIENLSPGNYEATVTGFYGSYNTYTDDVKHNMKFTIIRPSVVEIESVTKVDSWCNDGDGLDGNNNDGEIIIKAKGGNPGVFQYSYREVGESFSVWNNFNGGTEHRITGVKPGTYEIKVQKSITGRSTNCIAYELNSSNEPTSVVKVVPIEITEPDEPLQIEYTPLSESSVNEPTAYGFEDGRIKARIFGGTPKSDGTYRFEWKKISGGAPLTTINTRVLPSNQGYEVLLHSVGAGKYELSVWDDQYDNATYKEGCYIIKSEYTLEQPDPLIVTIEIANPVSCNITNEYNNGEDFIDPMGIADQFQDGVLIAHVTGGVRYNTIIPNVSPYPVNASNDLLPYYYTWKKNVGGTLQDIPVNDSIIRDQSVGDYVLNVKDRNGIVLGTYLPVSTPTGQEYILEKEIDSTKYLPQPEKFEVSFSKTAVTCTNGNDAEATAIVTGGTKPYTYRWSNGETSATIKNLIAQPYLVAVIDAKGCEVEGRVVIDQPNGLVVDPIEVVSPTCFEGNDGRIVVNISGGVEPYRYKWDDGQISTSISGLTAGTYLFEVIDKNDCIAFKEIQLSDPEPILVDMPEKRSLCAEQSVSLDIAIEDPGAVYSWSNGNGFTSTNSLVELTEAGRYIATITSSLGCIGIGEIQVDVFDTPIDADFLITTQAYVDEEVILVNVSEPLGELVEWAIPEGVEVILKEDDKLILKFKEEGPHDILLTSHQGDCFEMYTKTILVQPAIEAPEVFASQGEFIEEFIIYPNPSGGSFKAKISLAEDANIKVKIVNLISGATMHERSENDNQDFLLDYEMSMSTGVYLMLLETPKGSETRKLVVE